MGQIKMSEQFSKYERARILGARALQISMDAPILMKIEDDALSNINFDPLRIAEIELDSGVLPISVNRPLPARKKEKIEKIKVEESDVSDEEKIKKEREEEKEIAESSEFMQLANPEDEQESSSSGSESIEQ